MPLFQVFAQLVSLLALIVVVSISKSGQASAQTIDAALKGTWRSVCMDVGSSVYITITATYDGAGGSKDQVLFYKDAACATPTGMAKANVSSYTIGPKIRDENGMGVYPIDITINSSRLTQNGSVLQSGGVLPKQFDIVAVKGDTMYTSGLNRPTPGMITSPANRPTNLDMKNVYTRQ